MMGGTYDMMGGVAYGSMGETAPEVLGVPTPTSASAPSVMPYQKVFDHSPPGAVQQLHMGIGEARKAVRARNFDLALKILKDIMEAYPGSKQARLAEVEYQHIKELMHKSAVAGDRQKALAVARAALRDRKYQVALGLLDNIANIYPNTPEGQSSRNLIGKISQGLASGKLVEGSALIERRDARYKAKEQYVKARSENVAIAGDRQKALAVARAALRDRKYQVALTLLENIANIYPNTPEGQNSRSLIGKISQGLASGKLVEGSVLIERRDARYKAKEQYVKARSENVAIAADRGKAIVAAKLAIKGKRYQVALTLLENIANTYPNTHEERLARKEIQRILRGLANRTLIEGAR
jgi:outer membrane protein assembly factor BamD (BamD/ComL family)